MSTPTDPAAVERALLETGNAWILEAKGRDAVLKQIAQDIDEFINHYKAKFNVTPDPFALLSENPDKAAAFFELYTNPSVSTDMRVTVWRLIHGADIQSVRFEYDRDQRTDLVITLINGGPCAPEEYRGSSLGDFEVIRHFGILAVGGREILDGYYASQLPE